MIGPEPVTEIAQEVQVDQEHSWADAQIHEIERENAQLPTRTGYVVRGERDQPKQNRQARRQRER